MIATQLIAKGRLLSNSKSLPKLAASRIITSCNFSTTPNNVDTNNSGDGNNNNPPPISSSKKKHSQSFVQDDIELGLGELETELPPGFYQRMGTNRGQFRNKDDGRDSYWRPPWKNPRAEIISAEDFANRPRVTFSESFLVRVCVYVVNWRELYWQGKDCGWWSAVDFCLYEYRIWYGNVQSSNSVFQERGRIHHSYHVFILF